MIEFAIDNNHDIDGLVCQIALLSTAFHFEHTNLDTYEQPTMNIIGWPHPFNDFGMNYIWLQCLVWFFGLSLPTDIDFGHANISS